MKNKLLIVGVIGATALITGCSTNAELENRVTVLTNQVNELSAKVDGFASDHNMMKTETEAAIASAQATADAAASEADRANSRIDNIVDSYKK